MTPQLFHEVSIVVTTDDADEDWFTARCTCGWIGSAREDEDDADDDGINHFADVVTT